MKVKILIFISLLICSFTHSIGQNHHKIDSLKKVIDLSKHDTIKVKTLLEIGDTYYSINKDSSLFYYNRALKTINNIPGEKYITLFKAEADAYKKRANIHDAYKETNKTLSHLDHSINIRKKISDSIGIINCYRKKGRLYIKTGDYKSAIKSFFNSIEYGFGVNNSTDYGNLGLIYMYKGDYDSAEIYYNKVLLLVKSDKDEKKTSTTYSNIGLTKIYRGKYDVASTYFHKALVINEKTNNKSGISLCYNNLGLIQYYQKSYDKAIEYFTKSLDIEKKLKNKTGIAMCHNNIGLAFEGKSDYNHAVSEYKQALDIYLKLNYKKGISICYNNIGAIYSKQKKYIEAIRFYDNALNYKKELDDKNGMAYSYWYLADTYLSITDSIGIDKNDKTEYLYKAVHYGKLAFHIADSINAIPLVNDISRTLIKAYKKLNLYNEALTYSEIYISTQDSMYSKEKTNAIQEMETKYETEKKEIELEKQIDINSKQAEINNKQKIIITGGIIALSVIFLLAILFFIQFRQKKKANIILGKQKEEILLQANKIKEVNKELEKLSMVASKTDNSVIIANAQGVIEWINMGFTRIYGYTYEELINEKGSNIIASLAERDIQFDFIDLVANNQSLSYENKNITKSGNTLWMNTTITPMLDSQGNIERLLIVESDITELKKAASEIKKQNTIIETKNKHITDSINAAKIIQDAILPEIHEIKQYLPDLFILFKPRDIVSGDFYWFQEIQNKQILIVADCTGHGVPGAFMSMIGNTLLNEIIINNEITTPAYILEKLDQEIKSSLHKKEGRKLDVMAISICKIDKAQGTVELAAANHEVILINSGKLNQINGEMLSIGDPMSSLLTDYSYTNHTFNIEEGATSIYMFSDGFVDQFGGEDGDKFMYPQFEDMIKEISQQPIDEQKKHIEKRLAQWMSPNLDKTYDQLDDILLVGLKI